MKALAGTCTRALLAIGCATWLAGCATPPVETKTYIDVRQAARGVAATLSEQLGSGGGPAAIGIGPAVSMHSGEIGRSGRDLQTFIFLDLRSMLPERPIKKLSQKNADAEWLVTAIVKYEKPTKGTSDDNWFNVEFRAISPQGAALPPIPVRINARQFDPTPSRFFQDAPMYLVDAHTRARAHVIQTVASEVNAATRRRFLQVEYGIEDGIAAYESTHYEDAEKLFTQVEKIDPSNLTALSGRYQSLVAQKRWAEAESALGDVVDAGIKNESLSFRFLFRVGSTDFRDDIEIAAQYPMWLKQIARRIANTNHCLKVQGHTSRSGASDYNEALSLQRAKRVAEVLLAEEPGLKKRITWEGLGYSKNIVGSATDDATDSIDRRVDFSLHRCQA